MKYILDQMKKDHLKYQYQLTLTIAINYITSRTPVLRTTFEPKSAFKALYNRHAPFKFDKAV